MATIFRGPLFSQKQVKPPQSGSGWTVTPRFLTTLVLASAVPFKSPTQEVVGQQHPSRALSANPDTSRGIPKTLFADSAKAFFNAPTFAPAVKGLQGFLNPDTSRGIPKVLFADARNAFANPPHKAPDRLWPVTDTSQESPLALLSTLFVQPPFSNPPGLRVDRLLFAYDDTSQNASAALYATPPVPVANVPTWTSPRLLWKGLDSSAGTPKVLYADAVAPKFNPPHLQLDRLRPTADTTRGVLPAFFPTVAPPFVNPPHSQVGVPRGVVDTSTGASLALLSFVPPPPFANPPPTLSPRFFWQPADTSAGIPKPSVGDDALPTFNPPFLTADRIRPVTDTSRGFTIGVTGAPFAQWDWPAPIARVHRQFHGWDRQANPGTIPDALPVFPPPDKVLAGFVYGPHSNDYTGTLVVTTTSGGGVYLRRR